MEAQPAPRDRSRHRPDLRSADRLRGLERDGQRLSILRGRSCIAEPFEAQLQMLNRFIRPARRQAIDRAGS
jgi:hypothetical protein